MCFGDKGRNDLPLDLVSPSGNDNDTCEFKFPTNMSADVVENKEENQNDFCDVNIRAVIPVGCLLLK